MSQLLYEHEQEQKQKPKYDYELEKKQTATSPNGAPFVDHFEEAVLYNFLYKHNVKVPYEAQLPELVDAVLGTLPNIGVYPEKVASIVSKYTFVNLPTEKSPFSVDTIKSSDTLKKAASNFVSIPEKYGPSTFLQEMIKKSSGT